jgi:hypothetical protein
MKSKNNARKLSRERNKSEDIIGEAKLCYGDAGIASCNSFPVRGRIGST